MAKATRTTSAAPSRVVSGVGTASSASASGSDLSARLEVATVKAIEDCLAKGVSDPGEQKAAMKAARDKVLAEG